MKNLSNESRLKLLFSLGTLIIIGAAVAVAASNRPQVIYGPDDRKEIYQIRNSQISQWVRAVAAIIDTNKLVLNSRNRVYNITPEPPSENEVPFCNHEPFIGQPAAASCTGFLIAPQVMVSAGHCFSSKYDCNNFKFAFSFGYESRQDEPTVIAMEDVYSCLEILKTVRDFKTQDDFAIIKLDRPVLDRIPLDIRTQGTVDINDPLLIIGHPNGFPTKVAGNANAQKLEKNYFTANLDSYIGNSGGPVINTSTGIVEGILVRGTRDYRYNDKLNCRESFRCDDDTFSSDPDDPERKKCPGEEATHISNIVPYIPQNLYYDE